MKISIKQETRLNYYYVTARLDWLLPSSAQFKLQWNWAGFIPSFFPPDWKFRRVTILNTSIINLRNSNLKALFFYFWRLYFLKQLIFKDSTIWRLQSLKSQFFKDLNFWRLGWRCWFLKTPKFEDFNFQNFNFLRT